MNRAPSSPVEVPAGTGFETELATASTPAWVIDVGKVCILAANKAGASRLGLGRESIAVLDETMPALARLRDIQRETARPNEVRERLTFWTRNGLEDLHCLVRRTDDTPHAPLLIQVVDADPANAPVSTPQDDARTLARIAAAIRTGCAERRAAAEHADNPSPIPGPAGTPPAPATDENPGPNLQAVELARLAHELKTPLSAIVAAAEIMKDERFGPIANQRYGVYITDIHASARHALAVINGMLGKREVVSESSGPDLIFTEVDLEALVDGTVSTMRPIAEQAGLTLILDGEPRLPRVIADATSLKQILLNLLTNAVKFTGSGGRITVRTQHTADGSVLLNVRDTGSGISDAEIARVRDATGQPMPRVRDTDGLGLGLPLVKMLAAANGARLQIRRAPEGGTEIVVAFAKSRVVLG